MKYFIYLALFLALFVNLYSQNVGIGDGAEFTPHSSSILELRTTSKGFLLPRMTRAQRVAIATPAHGLMVIQTDNDSGDIPGIWYYNDDDSSWHFLGGSNAFSFANITAGTNLASLLIGSGGSLAPTGTGTITANIFTGSGSTTNAVDLATAEVAGILPVANGGTGLTSVATNHLLYGNGTSALNTLAPSNSSLLTTTAGGVPQWTSLGLGLLTGDGSLDQIAFFNTDGELVGSNNFTFDGASNEFNVNGDMALGTTSSPNASSILDIVSSTSGILIPRMTSAQKTAIASPATGLLVYQTDGTAGFQYYNGTSWVPIGDGYFWNMTGNAGTTAGTNFIGTTDAVDFVFKSNNLERMRLLSGGSFILSNDDNTARELRFQEPSTSGSNYTAFRAAVQAADLTYTLPTAQGAASTFLQNDGSGNLTWAAGGSSTIAFDDVTSGTVLNQSLSVGNGSSLAPTGTGTITANQFTGSGSTTNAVDLATAEVAGTLPVANGGTGLTSVATNHLLYGNGTSALNTLAPSNSSLLTTTAGGVPQWTSLGLGLLTGDGSLDQIAFFNTDGELVGSNNFTFDGASNEFNVNGDMALGTTSSPNASSILDIVSTTSGILIPRMTSAQKTAIASPATGLLVYQTDGTAGFQYYNGTSWVPIGNGYFWNMTGNANTTAGTNFIGTTDAVDFVFKSNNLERMRLLSGGSFLLSNDDNTARELRFQEPSTSGSNFTAFKAAVQAADITYTLPTAQGAALTLLQNDGSGNLTWVSPSATSTVTFTNVTAGTVAGEALLVGNGASLAPTGTGTITANLFTGTGSTTNAVDLATAEVAGTLPVANGGTGLTTIPTNSLLLGNGTSAMNTLATANSSMLITNASGVPQWINLADNQYLWNIKGNNNINSSTDFLGTTNAVDLIFKTNNSERIRILSGGNVGINTINPAQKLEVNNGNILLNNTGTAGELIFNEPNGSGTNYSSFKAQIQANNIAYTLPDSLQESGSALVLKDSTTGELEWKQGYQLGISINYVYKTSANYTAKISNTHILCINSADIKITLPVSPTGKAYFVKRLDGTVTIQPSNSTETIDGYCCVELSNTYAGIMLIADENSDWYTITTYLNNSPKANCGQCN